MVAGDGGHRVLPDACVDIVWREDAGLEVAGPDTAAWVAAMPAGSRAAGVRLRPGAAAAVLGEDVRGFLDARVPASRVWGDDARRLEERLHRAADPAGLIAGWLLERRPSEAPDPLVAAVAGRLEGDPGTQVQLIAADVAIGERQLRRRVAAAVGYGPKRLARVLRMQRALLLRAERPALGWAGVAAAAGYADQPHLVEDVRALAGVTPTVLDHRLA